MIENIDILLMFDVVSKFGIEEYSREKLQLGNVPLVGISAAREMQKCSHGQGGLKSSFFAPTGAQKILMYN